MYPALDRVSSWLVTPANPPRFDDRMDHERCIALHNAIIEHMGLRIGQKPELLDAIAPTWWEYNMYDADESPKRMHPSLWAFLTGARLYREGVQKVGFFFHLDGLTLPSKRSTLPKEYRIEDDSMGPLPLTRHVLLYRSPEGIPDVPFGLFYDQETHKAAMTRADSLEIVSTHGQPLESILSVYIEVILRQKVSVVRSISTRFDIDVDLERPLSIKALYPWEIAPRALSDVTDSLTIWTKLVTAIESRMMLGPAANQDKIGAQGAMLPPGFAVHFLVNARRPRFRYMAPGLAIPSPQEIAVQQQFFDPEVSEFDQVAGSLPPILLFRGHDIVQTSDLSFPYPYGGPSSLFQLCNTGLYLDRYDSNSSMPSEDGCRLVLPFEFDQGWAKKSDGSPVKGKDELLESDFNPYLPNHGVSLRAFLGMALENVDKGYWAIDGHGVAGGIEVWKEADTRARCSIYQVKMGPGRSY